MTSDFQFTVAKDEVTGIYKGTLDIQLPPINVTRYKADKNDFKYRELGWRGHRLSLA